MCAMRMLLVPIGADGYRCELDRCRRESPAVGAIWDVRRDGGLRQLSRPLRMFITGPGIAEIELEAALARRGLEAEMWPNFDAYDLRITFPTGRVWAVDVKDRANPILLGRGSGPLPTDPPYHRAFLVVPRYRFEERDGYRRIFEQHLSTGMSDSLQLMSDREFLRAVSTELGGFHRPVRGEDDA
jgi:hypothetical protein